MRRSEPSLLEHAEINLIAISTPQKGLRPLSLSLKDAEMNRHFNLAALDIMQMDRDCSS